MQTTLSILTLPLMLAVLLWIGQSPDVPTPVGPTPARERNWEEILGGPRAQWPSPRPSVHWFDNFDEAKVVAARERRPLFVVMRCLPCKQCADFDADVLEGRPGLAEVLRQFICVRLTSIATVDLRQFPMAGFQDLDLSWWGWFIAPEGSIYGVFGGKDETGDRARISIEALATAMNRVLDHHFDPRRGDWNVDIQPARGEKPVTPFDLPGFKSWALRHDETQPIECLHCHQVAEILRQPALDAKTFDKQRDLEIWPYPENIGIVVERNDGLLVTTVAEGSPAAAAGIQPGDRIRAAGSKKLFSQADLRAALQRVESEGGTLVLRWKRATVVMEGTLELKPGWKRVVLDWRQSIAGGNIGAPPGLTWPNAMPDGERKRLGIPPQTMAIKPFFAKQGSWAARRAGVIESDVIIGVNGDTGNRSGREFLVWFRTRFEPGDEVTLKVRNARGLVRDVTYKLTANGR